MPKITKANIGKQFKTYKVAGGRRVGLQQTKNTTKSKEVPNLDKVKNIIDDIEYIITNELPRIKTEEEKRDMLNKITKAYLKIFINYGVVKTKDELYKNYIEPLAEKILEENEQKRQLNYKLQDLFYKLITAKTEVEENSIKKEYIKLEEDMVKYGIYNTAEDYISNIEKILSDKKEGLIEVNSEDKITNIITKDENENKLSEYCYVDGKLIEYINYKYDANNNLISEEYYDCDNIKTGSIKYEYDDNSANLKHLIELDENDVEVCRYCYINGSKTPNKYIEYNPTTQLITNEAYFYDDTMIPKHVILYNKQEQKIKEIFYKKDGKTIQSSVKYKYNDNIQIENELNGFFKNNIKKTIEYNGYGNIKEINIFRHNNNNAETQIYTIDENKNNINTTIKRYYNKNGVGGCDFVFCSKPNVNLVILFEFDGNGKYIDVVLEKNDKEKFGQLPNFIENNISKIEQEAYKYKTKQQELLKQESDIITEETLINQEIKEVKETTTNKISIKDAQQLLTEVQEQIRNSNEKVQESTKADNNNCVNKNDLDMLQQRIKECDNVIQSMINNPNKYTSYNTMSNNAELMQNCINNFDENMSQGKTRSIVVEFID